MIDSYINRDRQFQNVKNMVFYHYCFILEKYCEYLIDCNPNAIPQDIKLISFQNKSQVICENGIVYFKKPIKITDTRIDFESGILTIATPLEEWGCFSD